MGRPGVRLLLVAGAAGSLLLSTGAQAEAAPPVAAPPAAALAAAATADQALFGPSGGLSALKAPVPKQHPLPPASDGSAPAPRAVQGMEAPGLVSVEADSTTVEAPAVTTKAALVAAAAVSATFSAPETPQRMIPASEYTAQVTITNTSATTIAAVLLLQRAGRRRRDHRRERPEPVDVRLQRLRE